jgi:hypothetical protein
VNKREVWKMKQVSDCDLSSADESLFPTDKFRVKSSIPNQLEGKINYVPKLCKKMSVFG